MSTHAAIIARTPTGEYRGIYVHSDGYPDHTGRLLQEHYATEENAAALIDLGDLSFLDKRIAPEEGERHTFRDSAPGVTIAYHRDRGEAKRITHSARPEVIATLLDWSHLYLWEDGEWHIFTSSQWSDYLRDQAEQAEADAGWDPNP
jgi:hypothetical protein